MHNFDSESFCSSRLKTLKMALSLYKTVKQDGVYSCGDIGISAEEWYSLIANPKAEQYIETLLCFLRAQNHKASCSSIASSYGEASTHYVGKINGFAKWVQRTLNRFEVSSTEGDMTYWPIPMRQGRYTSDGFEYQLRDELVEALQRFLKEKLVAAYKTTLRANGSLSAKNAYEIYKWEIANDCKGRLPEKIVSRLGQSDCNLIDMQRCKPSLLSFCKTAPEESDRIILALLDDKIALNQRISTFYNSLKQIWNPDWGKTVPNDERTAAAILASFNPDAYPYYKWDVYDTYCKYIGAEEMPTRQCYGHFIELMSDLYKEESKDSELVGQIDSETSRFFHSDVFCAQDIVWQTQEWMKNQIKKQRQTSYWMAGFILGDQDKKKDFLNYGYWMGVGPANMNKKIESIRSGDILMLKSSYTRGKGHKTSAVRIYAVGIVKSKPVKSEYCYRSDVEWIATAEKEFTGFEGSYRNTLHKVTDELFINYAKEQLDMTEKNKYQTYIDLLTTNRNLVLTGAPGTGKTFMAQEIAREMNAEMKFVQFHPSYDYTDFVEGLRPVDNDSGRIGFERKDGVFKAFCRDAAQNIIDSEKSPETLEGEENSVERKPYVFIIDEINRGEASKIFGELFYAIDPGYRGKTDIRVQTQYQNLVPDTDIFSNGFYVPDNVYILATMNDIDRSVESMDFAMRRRFTWKEVTPDDTKGMLDVLGDKADNARNVMERINNEIAATEGLGKAYEIGPSYFLRLKENGGSFEDLWTLSLEPLLREYLRGFRKSDEILKKFHCAYIGEQKDSDE